MKLKEKKINKAQERYDNLTLLIEEIELSNNEIKDNPWAIDEETYSILELENLFQQFRNN